LEIRATGSERRLETLARTSEFAAGAHREHRGRAAVVVDRHFAATVVAATVVAAGMRAEDEAGEEDHGDDEDDAGHDADPCGHRSEPAVASRLRIGWTWLCGGSGRGNRAGLGVRRQRCFTHDLEHASDADVPVLNWI
jgi:hypothetical protein